MRTQVFQKFYGSITEVPETIFQQNVEVLAAQLAQASWLLSQGERKGLESSRRAQI